MARTIFHCLISAVCLVAFLSPVACMGATAASDDQILHLLNRISFGPAPGDLERVRAMGIQGYIDQQLHPAYLPPSIDLNTRLAQLSTLNASMPDLLAGYFVPDAQKKEMNEEDRKTTNKHERQIILELSEAKILRAVMSPAQLQEVMTDFWFNHFNVFSNKGLDKIFVGAYERDAIRPYALGKFRDLLFATAYHPAMLIYLDNAVNTDPDSLLARGKKLGINENYAREVMELHTLGVSGGYSQQDVTTLAHILTGWGLGSNGRDVDQRAVFYFEPRRHDFSNQQFLGRQINGGGIDEVQSVLDLLAHHPSTARHIASEIAQYFVSDDPPPSLVEKLTASFTANDGDTTAVLKTLFAAPEFWDPRYEQVKFKPPFRYIVSAIRAAHVVPADDTIKLQMMMNQMGEPLYGCQTPNGYSITNDQWLNSDALLKRISFAQMLAQFIGDGAASTIEGSEGKIWSTNTLDIVHKADPKLQPALLLSSPEFVYY